MGPIGAAILESVLAGSCRRGVNGTRYAQEEIWEPCCGQAEIRSGPGRPLVRKDLAINALDLQVFQPAGDGVKARGQCDCVHRVEGAVCLHDPVGAESSNGVVSNVNHINIRLKLVSEFHYTLEILSLGTLLNCS